MYILFTFYMGGSLDTGYWSGAITYSKGDLVRDLTGVYESLSDGNIGNAITDSTYWLKVLNSFIGASERVKFDGKYLKLTWALNREFNTTFRQPPYPAPYDFGTGSGTFSDIYITNAVPTYVPFVVGLAAAESSHVGLTPFTFFVPIEPTYTSASAYAFVIHIPTAVYTALGATTAIRKSIVDKFVGRYAVVGTYWTIVTY